MNLAWFYKWRERALGPAAASGLFTVMDHRRDTIDRAVQVMFNKKHMHDEVCVAFCPTSSDILSEACGTMVHVELLGRWRPVWLGAMNKHREVSAS